MLGVIVVGTFVFFATWVAAVATAAAGLWLPAAILTAVAFLAWTAACGATLAYVSGLSRRRRTRALVLSGVGVSVALYTLTAWFGVLYATLYAYDPAALVSSIPDGNFRPYSLAVDAVIGQGIGMTLPGTTAAAVVTMLQELLLSPRLMLALLLVMQFVDRQGRDDDRRPRGENRA